MADQAVTYAYHGLEIARGHWRRTKFPLSSEEMEMLVCSLLHIVNVVGLGQIVGDIHV